MSRIGFETCADVLCVLQEKGQEDRRKIFMSITGNIGYRGPL